MAPAHILFSMGTFIFLTQEIKIKNDVVKKCILTVSSHSFTVYILHHIVKKEVEKIIVGIPNNLLQYCTHFILTFCISFLLAIILDKFLFTPFQKLLKKINISNL